MGFKNVLIAEIANFGTDKYPVIKGSFMKLYSSGLTNRTLTWTKNVNSKDINADDDVEISEDITNVTGALNCLGVDSNVRALIENVAVDKNSNLIGRKTGAEKPHFVMVYQYQNVKGKPVQMWLYNVTFSEARSINHTQPGDQGDLTYNFTANKLPGDNRETIYAEVFENNPGWISDISDLSNVSVYKEATA